MNLEVSIHTFYLFFETGPYIGLAAFLILFTFIGYTQYLRHR